MKCPYCKTDNGYTHAGFDYCSHCIKRQYEEAERKFLIVRREYIKHLKQK